MPCKRIPMHGWVVPHAWPHVGLLGLPPPRFYPYYLPRLARQPRLTNPLFLFVFIHACPLVGTKGFADRSAHIGRPWLPSNKGLEYRSAREASQIGFPPGVSYRSAQGPSRRSGSNTNVGCSICKSIGLGRSFLLCPSLARKKKGGLPD